MRDETKPALTRANLQPKLRHGAWVARGFVPIRQDDGTIARRRVERGLRGDTASARRKEVDDLNHAYEEAAARLELPISFARAYSNYVTATRRVPIYHEKILHALGRRRCVDINDTVLTELRNRMFEPNAAPSYINRHLYTPVLAILRMALGNAVPRITRPKGHKRRADGTDIRIPPDSWYATVAAHMSPTTKALMYFLATHGRRLGDALGRVPADFDPERGTLVIGTTKNGEPLLVTLHPEVTALINAMPGWRSRRWLFGDGPASPNNVRQDIQVACAAAGVEYFAPHELGRHSFATRMLRHGYSLQYVKDAGGWKSIEIVSRLYGHLERKEWHEGVIRSAGALFGSGDKVGEASKTLPMIDQKSTGETGS